MRLQLIVSAVSLVSSVAGARAQDVADETRLSGSVAIYADSDHMTVVSPRVGGRQPVTDELSVEVQVAADVISGASVDVVSEASPAAIREVRLEGSLGVAHGLTRAVTTRVRARVSHEEDYRALGAEAGVRLEMRERTTILDLAVWGGADRVEAVTRPGFSERRTDARAYVTWTQVVDRRTVTDVIVELQRRAGYLANPYRTVPLTDPGLPVVMRVDERVPETRAAAAGAMVVRRALGPRTFARAGYRYYRDDWAVNSHTAHVVMMRDAGQLQLGAEARGYAQSGASFYRRRYELEGDAAPSYRTRERRLGAMASGSVGLMAELAVRGDLRALVAVSITRFYWLDFAAQAKRDAVLVTLGAAKSF